MNPTRQVVMALIVSGLVFVAAGNQAYARAGKVGTLLQGSSTTTGAGITPPVNVRVVFGWATMTLFLIIGSELPGLGDLSAAFAWLIAIGFFLTEGPAAFANLTSILGGATPSAQGHGSGGTFAV